MQTKQQIQQLLASAGASPNKRLGQHFLIDLNLMRLLVDSAHIKNNDIVLEVGCGTGSLTEALADNAGMVVAVERDKALAEIAKTQLAPKGNVLIINTDILETKNAISPTVTKAIQLCQKKYAGRILLVANLPYNAASPVMLNLITGSVTVDSMYVTVQKEVAQRITAAPGQKHYGTLSIFLAATGDVKTIRVLKPTVFWPQPQVNSAMISFVRKKTKASRIKNTELFNNAVHLFMQHRRKMLKTSTKLITGKLTQIKDWPEIFEKCSIDPTQRPDQLSPENYIAIANLCSERLNQE
ncbi:MAG: 16S rRNA (adenine(1518)-N(6)/adenine(1519)-N(6))-dimethyltransferase RsmA [Planctomycetota bacterium]|jgi:16S rRNA (adenine1518-N6/adenine1519-N6)-dimethyltransferase